jgi:hypothetical protein
MCSALMMVTMTVVKPYIDTQGFLGPFFLSKDRFSLCSYGHLMFETNIDSCNALVHCELTSKWNKSGKFRIYLNNGFGRSPETSTGVILRGVGFRTCPLLDIARGYALHIWRPIIMCRP